jgi:DNA-directed RNA polymerase subunit RPC12/RpoP
MKIFDIDNLKCPQCGSLTPPIMINGYVVKCPECGYSEVK